MAQVPTGTTFHIATAFGPVKAVTAISQAVDAVVGCATHDYAVGDIVEMTSAWGRLNRRVYRVKAVVAGASFTLDGANTTNPNFYPAGMGVGSVRKITEFKQITQVMNPQSSGGDPKTVNYKYVESDVEYSINDGFAATNYTMELDADSIGNSGYAALVTLTEVQTDTCLKMVSRSGAQLFQPCTVAINEAVKLQDGQINRVTVAFNGNNRLTRYAA